MLIHIIISCILLPNESISSNEYTNQDGIFDIFGRCYNDGTSSVSTEVLKIGPQGLLLNGETNSTGTFYIAGSTNQYSEINGVLNNGVPDYTSALSYTAQNANFLNDGTIYITKPHYYDNNSIFTNYNHNAYTGSSGFNGEPRVITAGLFINQGTIIVGATGRLRSNNQFINDVRGGILNGFSHNKNITGTTKYYRYNNKAIEPVTDNNTEPRDGKIIFIPGAVIEYIWDDGPSIIDGGIIDLKSYIQIKCDTNTNKNYIDFEYLLKSEAKNDIEQYAEPYNVTADYTSAANLDNVVAKGYYLSALVKNATIQLFNETELANAVKLYNKFRLNSYILFFYLKFQNCTSKMPNDRDGYAANNIEIPYGETNIINDSNNLYKYKRSVNNNYYALEVSESNNYEQVKGLFNDSIHATIYHGVYKSDGSTISKVYNKDGETVYDSEDGGTSIPTNGLILLNLRVNNDSFSDLFNKFINYNCYITVPSSSLYTMTSNEITNSYLDLQFKYFGEPIGTNPYNKDIYIQLIGNKDVCISNSHTEIQDEEEVSQQYSRGLKLVLHNPWATSSNSYTGKLYRNLPDMAETLLTIEEVRNTLYSTSSDYEILQSLANYIYNFMKQPKYWNIVPQLYIDSLAPYRDKTNSEDCVAGLDYVLNNTLDVNKVIILGYFLENHQNTLGNTDNQATFISNYIRNNYSLIQKISDYNTNYDTLSNEEKQQVLEEQFTDFSNKYLEMLQGLSQYTLQFVQDTLDYDNLNQSHKDYLESGASNNDKLNYVLSNFTNIGQTAMLNYFLEKKRQDYNEDTVKNSINNAVKVTQISQNYDGPAFNNYKINFVNSRDANGNEISNDNTTALKNDCVYCEKVQYTVDYNCNNFSAGNNTTPLIVDEFTISQNINVNGNADTNSLQQSNILTQKLKIDEGAVFKLKGTINVRKLKKYDCVSNGLAYIN